MINPNCLIASNLTAKEAEIMVYLIDQRLDISYLAKFRTGKSYEVRGEIANPEVCESMGWPNFHRQVQECAEAILLGYRFAKGKHKHNIHRGTTPPRQ